MKKCIIFFGLISTRTMMACVNLSGVYQLNETCAYTNYNKEYAPYMSSQSVQVLKKGEKLQIMQSSCQGVTLIPLDHAANKGQTSPKFYIDLNSQNSKVETTDKVMNFKVQRVGVLNYYKSDMDIIQNNQKNILINLNQYSIGIMNPMGSQIESSCLLQQL